MNTKITLITGNPNKAKLVAEHLHAEIEHQAVDLDEIQSLDLAEIIEHKAREAYEVVHSPVLVDDVSLVFPALGRLPGPFVKWFLKELEPEGLCRLLDGHADRTAIATVLFGYFDGQELRTYPGEMRGSVAEHPRGDNGFGWTSVFIPDGYDKTYAEMTDKEQAQVAMQRFALEKLQQDLQ